MNLKKTIRAVQKPELYAPGESNMWTDDHISKKLLDIHLDPNSDLATRKPESVDSTLKLIMRSCTHSDAKILDLGCGPGIYTEKLASRGYLVTGIDYSSTAINHAKDNAKAKELSIEYLCMNYLEMSFKDQFDVIYLIFADFGVLIPDDRNALLLKVYQALKPGGFFIFDVINEKNSDMKFRDSQTWSVSEGGFWRDHPYLELAGGIHFPNDHVFLNQHTIVDDAGSCVTYRFWMHYYDPSRLAPVLENTGFVNIRTNEDILPSGDIWNGDNVTFFTIQKPI